MTDQKIKLEIPAGRTAEFVVQALDLAIINDTDEQRQAVARDLRDEIAKQNNPGM